tara:strand:+ start:46 stop:852 length:807 start_codon:yes stop_codon:yes gene_type:complete
MLLIKNFFSFLLLPIKRGELFLELIKIHYKKSYGDSILKYFWVFFHQIFLILFYSFIFNYFMKFSSNFNLNYDYSIYIISGLIQWFFFIDILSNYDLLKKNKDYLIKKIFPFEIIFFVSLVISMIPFLTNIIVLMFIIYFKYQNLHFEIIYLPFYFIFLMLFALGILIIFSLLNLLLKDFKEFLRIFIIIGMFISPIIYMPNFNIPILDTIIMMNPFSYFITFFKDIVFYGGIDINITALMVFLLSIISSFSSFLIFSKFKDRVREWL